MTTSSTKEVPPIDWREARMTLIRRLIKQADANIIEEMKYKTASNPAGVPVWYCDGMICTGETYKQHLRLTFAKGPLLKELDPTGLFNKYRAMVIHENDRIDESAFVDLIRAAVALNRESKQRPKV